MGPTTYRIFVRDLVLSAGIGIYAHERDRRQRVRVNLSVIAERDPDEPGIDGVVSYEDLIIGIKDIVERGHIDLVELFADAILDVALAEHRVAEATVMIEKLDVFGDVESVGVEMTRRRVD
ncbi:MAG: dihydroneopterin aldolase [Pseudomonadota bacterium]|nr:dihydroneopterin aldolase [Pseudomonadota bacterium]